jgi:pimeloyl-ACP methyl ester carboxylesterase
VARTAAHYPNLVRGLVLEDPPWTYPPATAAEWGTQLDHVRADALARKDMTTEEMVEYSLCINPGMKRWDKSELDPWSEGKRLVSEHVMEGLRSDLPQWQDTVRRIACPTLLLTADPAKGAAITPAAVQRIMALNPKMKIVNIAEAGHNIRREAFEKYIEVVTAFLSNPGK